MGCQRLAHCGPGAACGSHLSFARSFYLDPVAFWKGFYNWQITFLAWDNCVCYLAPFAIEFAVSEYLDGYGVKQGLLLSPGDDEGPTSRGCASKDNGRVMWPPFFLVHGGGFLLCFCLWYILLSSLFRSMVKNWFYINFILKRTKLLIRANAKFPLIF